MMASSTFTTGLATALLVLVVLSGCSPRETFDESLARRHLAAVCENLPAELRILYFRPGSEDESEVWIFSSDMVPTLMGMQSSKPQASFAASSVLSFALSLGVAEQELPMPVDPAGSLTEGSVDGASVRIRSIKIDQGFFCVVERINVS